ncbi:MAG: TrbI/VirB10 family protein [Cellvibrionaceae bacterium]
MTNDFNENETLDLNEPLNNDELDEDIVSVNDKGRRDTNAGAKVAFIVVILAVGFVALLYGYTRLGGNEESLTQINGSPIIAENKKARVANARSFTDTPPTPEPEKDSANTEASVDTGALVGRPLVSSQANKGTSSGEERSRYGGKIVSISPAAAPTPSSNNYTESTQSAPRGQVANQALDTLMEIAKSSANGATKQAPSSPQSGGRTGLSENLQSNAISTVKASRLPNLNMTIAKGKQVNCILTSRIVSQLPGFVSCVLDENVYSENGKVLLWEKGSVATGEYEGGISDGQDSIFVMWDRVRTPTGVTMNFNSPGTDSLGTSGIPGHVNGRWMKRIGGAFLLSIFKDGVGFYTAKEAGPGSLGTEAYSNSIESGDKFAEKILDKTINMGPLLIKNHGDRIGIYVARDLDFSNVYEVVKN